LARGGIVDFGGKMQVRSFDCAQDEDRRPQFWAENEGGVFGKVFESWKTYKNLCQTYKKQGSGALKSWKKC